MCSSIILSTNKIIDAQNTIILFVRTRKGNFTAKDFLLEERA